MLEVDLLALFLAGLLGGGHCVGMCSGIVTAFSLQLPATARWPYLLGFNLGRLAGYALIGALLGGLASFALLLQLQALKLSLFVLANLLLLLLGLYIAGVNRWLTRVEALGQPLWRRVQPLMRRLLPVRSVWHTPLIGLLWGWIPCGLVYTASLSALASGSASHGAGVMLAFGLGTLPNLLLMGLFARQLQQGLQKPWVRPLCGGLIVAMALWQLYTLLGIYL
ncbi:sulfite exporter TauE/SafE family protein [Chitinibacter tainanensis]|uniref:sulfite exporter TauE/SafE family protein n=1 Tax=Chitinibacter tainanensis TaxID=230667 RepID=UPI000429AD8B|nr:sulfite exporter TauE/SafE family protein [Chitinibacter tainanensis]